MLRPLHVARHFLNPESYYSNPEAEEYCEVTTGAYSCIIKMVAYSNTPDKLLHMTNEGSFGMPLAARPRNTRAPGDLLKKLHQII